MHHPGWQPAPEDFAMSRIWLVLVMLAIRTSCCKIKV